MAMFFAIVAAVLTLPIGMPVILFGLRAELHWGAILSRRGFWIAIVSVAILATPTLVPRMPIVSVTRRPR